MINLNKSLSLAVKLMTLAVMLNIATGCKSCDNDPQESSDKVKLSLVFDDIKDGSQDLKLTIKNIGEVKADLSKVTFDYKDLLTYQDRDCKHAGNQDSTFAIKVNKTEDPKGKTLQTLSGTGELEKGKDATINLNLLNSKSTQAATVTFVIKDAKGDKDSKNFKWLAPEQEQE